MSGVLTAVVFFLTGYFHIPSHTGYTHVGDGIIYISACMIPLPYALFTAVIGAVLADILTGYTIWAPASLIIKALTVLFFGRRSKKIITAKNILALIPAGILCSTGYYIYESLITGNFAAPLLGIPGYITQSLLSSALFILLGTTFDKLNVKEQLLNY